MSTVGNQIKCLERYKDVMVVFDDIFAFLLEEGVITKDDAKGVQREAYQPKAMYTLLTRLSQQNLIQMLEYEWNILPIERIKILIVTNRNQREFTYNH
jgi:hypothetical protein